MQKTPKILLGQIRLGQQGFESFLCNLQRMKKTAVEHTRTIDRFFEIRHAPFPAIAFFRLRLAFPRVPQEHHASTGKKRRHNTRAHQGYPELLHDHTLSTVWLSSQVVREKHRFLEFRNLHSLRLSDLRARRLNNFYFDRRLSLNRGSACRRKG